MELLRRILAQPTVAFCEQAVAAEVYRWADEAGFSVEADRVGNLKLVYSRGRKKTRWVVHAHMDHPGFVTTRRRGSEVWCEFRGGVHEEYFVGSRVRFLAAAGDVCGTVETMRMDSKTRFRHCRVKLDESAAVAPGDLGVWDVPAVRRRGKFVEARACDDLACVAASLAMLERLAAEKRNAHVTVWLTRAEEVGFGGTLSAMAAGSLDRKAWYIGLECSKAMPAAKIGDGVAIRVGDRLMSFDPELGYDLVKVTQELTTDDKNFHYSRALMDSGGTETSALVSAGYRAAALALPLGNYHNMGPKDTIAAERIAYDDYCAMVTLLTEMVSRPTSPATSAQELKKALAQHEKTLRPYWKASPICLQ